MTTFDSYANERIGFYEARFQCKTNQQLAEAFSTMGTSRGWTVERSYYSSALTREMQKRGINLANIINDDNGRQTIHCVRVLYEEKSHAMIPAN
jgi:hypothetical protein